MRLKNDFIAQAKKVNPTYARFKKSSLHAITKILGRIPDPPPGMPAMPTSQDLDALAREIVALRKNKTLKYEKYKAALQWLQGRVGGLTAKLTGATLAVGQTAAGYVPGKEVRRKDKNNHWHKFYLQQKGNSCGPTCVRTILLAHTSITLPSEATIRNMMGLVEEGVQHTGASVSGHNWETTGSNVPSIVQVLKSYGLRHARSVSGLEKIRDALTGCSRNEPGIVGWWWGPSYGNHDAHHSGHWTSCVGPTQNGTELVILDPWTEIEYISRNSYWNYYPSGGGYGWFNPYDTAEPAVIVTHQP